MHWSVFCTVCMVSDSHSELDSSHLAREGQQHLVGEHLEVGVLAERAAVQLVVDQAVVQQSSSSGEALRNLLQEPLEVDGREGEEVVLDLRLVLGTLQSAPPDERIRLGTHTGLVIHRP